MQHGRPLAPASLLVPHKENAHFLVAKVWSKTRNKAGRIPAPSHNIFVPAVCIRVDGLAHRPKQPQARPAVPGHPFISLCMQRTHSGGCSVEDRHL
eukprot:1162014-Pelagomonas_calceolata.AAC.8